MQTYRIELAPVNRVVAVCTCGWRSAPVSRSGMAGAAFDQHVKETHR